MLRAAWRRFPGDYWVNFEPGLSSWTLFGITGGHFERPDEVLRFFSAAVAIRPGSSYAFNMLGIALFRKGDVDGAIAAYQEAIRLRPEGADLHNNFAYVCLERETRVNEAIAEFRRAQAVDPEHYPAQKGLARAFKAQGKLDEAIIAYREAVRLKPDDPEAFSILANSLLTERK